ncbi:hypothetical protein B0H34DRAFT_105261 [Crassisporium funariophilum]|nr:hypothetical protein B0H34DRAFT_105261 [Crassisporium funariophilum]
MDILGEAMAPGAFHNSGERYDPPKCHPSTRIAVLRKIMLWIEDLERVYRFFWLYGPAGCGKSAIAQTIAEMCHASGILAATFFFSRTAVGRSDEKRLIPTLVYQLCLSIPEIRSYVEEKLQQDPFIFSRNLDFQIHDLIVEPLNRASLDVGKTSSLHSRPGLIVIDGIDECSDSQSQRTILKALSVAVGGLSYPLFFLIASRPELHIRDSFDSQNLALITFRMPLDDSQLPSKDIELFLLSKFEKIKQNHRLRHLIHASWPSAYQVECLVRQSSGQFIYAATVIKYVDSPRHRPYERLDVIFGVSSSSQDAPYAELDALYSHIFSCVDPERLQQAQEILSLLLLFTGPGFPLTHENVEDMLSLKEGDVVMSLADLSSIVYIPPATDSTSEIRLLHASLSDFILDKLRSGIYHIDAPQAHAALTRCCLKHMPKSEDEHSSHSLR